MSVEAEMEAAPETASFRHFRRMMWQTLRDRHEETVLHARVLGVAGSDEEARKVAARAARGEIRAFMSELLTRAPVPAVLEFMSVSRDWGSGERLLAGSDAVFALVDSTYPRPTWTDLQPLSPTAAEDDKAWSAWTERWANTLRATGPAAQAALGERTGEHRSTWTPWIVSAVGVLGVTTAVVVHNFTRKGQGRGR